MSPLCLSERSDDLRLCVKIYTQRPKEYAKDAKSVFDWHVLDLICRESPSLTAGFILTIVRETPGQARRGMLMEMRDSGSGAGEAFTVDV